MKIDPVMSITMEGSLSSNSLSAASAKAQPAKVTPGNRNPDPSTESEKALMDLVEAMEPYNIALKFSTDDETGAIVVQLIDQKSGDTLQQIPNPAKLHISAALSKLQGMILNCKA